MIKLIIFVSMITLVFSVPAYKGSINFKQNDGSSFSGKLKGDEWFNWVEDKEGDIIKFNKKSKDYEYAIIKDINGTLDLVPSGIKVGNKSEQSSTSGSMMPSLLKIDKKTLGKVWKQKKEEVLKRKNIK